ncbi:30S ribosomal protein S6 [Tautonia sociabilis]|uniref:Small ribosomal subunit protein bS6 n=1 Tax=Tautonia sociabilis TaxID=2080755 RepID=A0A432MKI9_9BACT|nr:30S ribosomal protein S6 [Tautonia sociabilis]RUL87598.1 30S ribosomal protein S6 [Tautonia sociabilis]
MPVNTYEGMFLLDSAKVATSWEESERHVHDLLRKHEAEIVASRQWDDRRLSYPIGPHKKGCYLLTYFRVDGAKIKELVNDLHLDELVIRELILKVHPKLVDHLVTQAMSFTPSDDSGPPDDDDRRDRRDRDRGERRGRDRDRDRDRD